MLEKYTKEQILAFIELGYKELGDASSKNVAVALIRGLPSEDDWEVLEVGSVLEELAELDIPRDYVPPRMLARRALALMFAFNETIRDLERSVGARVVDTNTFMRVHRMNKSSVAELYQLSDEEVDEVLAVTFRGRGV